MASDLRIEVGIVDDDRVRGGEGDAEAAGASGAEEDRERRVGLVELLDVNLTLHAIRRAVEPAEEDLL